MTEIHDLTEQEAVWDLSDMYKSFEDPALQRDKAAIRKKAEEFQSRWRGTVHQLNAGQLRDAINELESVMELRRRLHCYAQLSWSVDTKNPEVGASLQGIRELLNSVTQTIVFFELEWIALSEEQTIILKQPELEHYRYWLSKLRRYRNHVLSEAEERVMSVKDLTGRNAWVRYYEETMNSIPFTLNRQRVSIDTLFKTLHSPDRELRRQAMESLGNHLNSHSRSLTFIFNTILADCSKNDSLHKYPTWLSSRNLANAIPDESVNLMIDTIMKHKSLVSRYYTLKKRVLNLESMNEWDRLATFSDQEKRYSWSDARELVLKVYSAFHPEMGRIAALFFENNWIHARPQQGKRSGGFCSSVGPSLHPYILLNFDCTSNSLRVLAHELGHGIHGYLARKNGILQSHAPLTLSETASVFGEMLLYDALLENTSSDEERLTLLMKQIENCLSIVFVQAAFSRFEQAIHSRRRETGELTTDQYCSLWMFSQEELYGSSIHLTDNYRMLWAAIGHFVRSPGYVYAYAFGELIVLALFGTYREHGKGFCSRYLNFLSAGGSASPEDLLSEFDIDLHDAKVWERGIATIETMITQVENLLENKT